MSSSFEVTAAQPRPARWPWFALAGFLLVATIGSVLVAVNGESMAEQVPYIIAFVMFAAVGALIVSRDGRNTIGIMFLVAASLTAFSFMSGEIVTYAVERGHSGWWLVGFALLNNYGWLFGISPRSSSCRCFSPMAGCRHPDGARSSGSSSYSSCSSGSISPSVSRR